MRPKLGPKTENRKGRKLEKPLATLLSLRKKSRLLKQAPFIWTKRKTPTRVLASKKKKMHLRKMKRATLKLMLQLLRKR